MGKQQEGESLSALFPSSFVFSSQNACRFLAFCCRCRIHYKSRPFYSGIPHNVICVVVCAVICVLFCVAGSDPVTYTRPGSYPAKSRRSVDCMLSTVALFCLSCWICSSGSPPTLIQSSRRLHLCFISCVVSSHLVIDIGQRPQVPSPRAGNQLGWRGRQRFLERATTITVL
jgi:hypothetical protein